MNDAFFPALLIILQILIFADIRYIRLYITNKNDVYFKKFKITTFIIFCLGLVILATMAHTPEVVTKFKMQTMMVLESGLIFFSLLMVKARITIRVIKRGKSPEYYDISFFGKKVYRPDVVKKSELAIFILSMPFTLITGAYFLANVFFG